MTALLEVEGLTVAFGGMPVVEDLSFTLDAGEVLGIVGESGSGKSMTALALMRLIPPPGRLARGRVVFDGTDVATLSERAISPLTSLKDFYFWVSSPLNFGSESHKHSSFCTKFGLSPFN